MGNNEVKDEHEQLLNVDDKAHSRRKAYSNSKSKT